MRFKGEQFFVTADDGKKIDCMFIAASAAHHRQFEVADSTAPTMLMCNPNAGFYEFVYYQSDWLDFYLQHGINVCLWNYRGYGRSEGSPNPSAIKKDAEHIVAYLRTKK